MKCVIIIADSLPPGLIANTSAVLAMSIGDKIKGIVGDDLTDKDGHLHRGITRIPIPILKGDGHLLRSLRTRLLKSDLADLFYVDFCDVAQQSRSYQQYRETLQTVSTEQLNYLGLAICGPDQAVNSLTGDIGLLR